ncbi:MAG: ComF family protein, partial [Actinomycetota bacterium]|nr:ComF family protein [Actinomycetota bacterium]
MHIFHDLLDLVLPMSCVCCLGPGSLWCAGCRPISRPERLPLLAEPPVYASGEYADELREALLAYKERGIRGLVSGLAGYLGDAVDVAIRAGPSGGPRPLLVPVPSSRG